MNLRLLPLLLTGCLGSSSDIRGLIPGGSTGGDGGSGDEGSGEDGGEEEGGEEGGDDGGGGDYYSSDPTCTDRVLPSDTNLLIRWPYIQRVTQNEAVVAFGVETTGQVGQVSWGRDDAYASGADTTAVSLQISPSGLGEPPKDEPPEEGEPPPDDHPDSGGEEEPITIQLHHAVLTDLEPGTRYCYRVTVDGQTAASGLRFTTAPSSPDAPVKFVVFGDYGAGTTAQRLVHDAMLPHLEGAHLFFTLGDNAYGRGDYDELNTKVFEVYKDMWMEVPVFPVPGNHDYMTPAAAPYLENFFLPEMALKAEEQEEYWSLDWGVLHYLGLNTEEPGYKHSAEDPLDQLDWLEADLEANTRPWKVAAWHKPAVSGSPVRNPDPIALEGFVPFMEAYGVQLVMQGHNHFYERFEPQKASVATPTIDGGVTYVVSGGGGVNLYDTGHEELQAVVTKKHHFVVGELDTCTMKLTVIDKNGEIIDEWETTICE